MKQSRQKYKITPKNRQNPKENLSLRTEFISKDGKFMFFQGSRTSFGKIESEKGKSMRSKKSQRKNQVSFGRLKALDMEMEN